MLQKLAEGLSRIEHKIDLLLSGLAQQFGHVTLRPVGDKEHICPLCNQQVRYQADLVEQLIARSCGCSTGMQPLLSFDYSQPGGLPKQGTGNDGQDS